MSRLVIAIDGPAGSGKSTVAKEVAKRLGLNFLDTGAMYRCIALFAERNGVGAQDGEAAALLGESAHIAFEPGEPQRVLLNGEDVTEEIRRPEIGNLASALSVYSPVRRVLVRRQQEIVAQGGVTLEGRDVTTVVAPNADVRIFMTASVEERTRRRFEELRAKGAPVDYNELKRQIEERDHRDSTREDSPLKIGDGVVVIDTDGMTVEEVVGKVLSLASGKI